MGVAMEETDEEEAKATAKPVEEKPTTGHYKQHLNRGHHQFPFLKEHRNIGIESHQWRRQHVPTKTPMACRGVVTVVSQDMGTQIVAIRGRTLKQ